MRQSLAMELAKEGIILHDAFGSPLPTCAGSHMPPERGAAKQLRIDRQSTDSLAGRGEDRVADGRRGRRHSRFSDAARRMFNSRRNGRAFRGAISIRGTRSGLTIVPQSIRHVEPRYRHLTVICRQRRARPPPRSSGSCDGQRCRGPAAARAFAPSRCAPRPGRRRRAGARNRSDSRLPAAAAAD